MWEKERITGEHHLGEAFETRVSSLKCAKACLLKGSWHCQHLVLLRMVVLRYFVKERLARDGVEGFPDL